MIDLEPVPRLHEHTADDSALESGAFSLNPEQREAFSRVGRNALSTVTLLYGSGFPHFDIPGRYPLRNHGRQHSASVANRTPALLEDPDEALIGESAGAAHDVVQGQGAGTNERESAEIFAARLAREDAPASAIEAGKLAILGTNIMRDGKYQPIFDENGNVIQVALRQEYPSKSAERIALAVASADFGDVLTLEGPRLARELYREINDYNQTEPPIDEQLVEFQRKQLQLTRGLRFAMPEAERVLATHRREVEIYSALILIRLERGEIHSWQQLIEMDDEFMKDPTSFIGKLL